MILIVGLGNPGKEFERTRHNAGFIVLDKIASSFGFDAFSFEKKFNAMISEGKINDTKFLLLKPYTFMNSSGISVRTAMDYYKIPLENVIVIQDELDLSVGEYKFSKDRSSAGHKGIESIIKILGTKDFSRYRIGVNAPRGEMSSDKFVLSEFSDAELDSLSVIFGKICVNIKERV